MQWTLKRFDELTPEELYTLLRLRTEVFVVEQQCIFQDMDDKDQPCYHLMGWEENRLVAYTRLVPPGIIYTEPSIGRVVSSPLVRGRGIGRILMEKSIAQTNLLFGPLPIRIGAQVYLQAFYTGLGFSPVSEPYLEDGIPHIEMVRDIEKV
ncbi:MAG: GNAT family N-acetyltransferase [Bacteroidetes bacterium]|nr:GNAT family N-acetyltransferase [Bacteroidota bacterium]